MPGLYEENYTNLKVDDYVKVQPGKYGIFPFPKEISVGQIVKVHGPYRDCGKYNVKFLDGEVQNVGDYQVAKISKNEFLLALLER